MVSPQDEFSKAVNDLVDNYLKMAEHIHSIRVISPRHRNHIPDIAKMAELLDVMEKNVETLMENY